MFLLALHLQGDHMLCRGRGGSLREQSLALSLIGRATLDEPTCLDLSFLTCKVIVVPTSQGC